MADIERLLRDSGTVLEPAVVDPTACRDAGNMHVLGLARAGRADYLVTGDADLSSLGLFGRCRIVTPRRFWSLMHNVKPDRGV